jgi:ankyrin repeat protein
MAAPLKVSLVVLAEKGDLAAIKSELKRHPNNKNDKSHDKGYHALTAAVLKKHYDIIQYLLENFIEVDLVDRGGDTALLHACSLGDEKIVQMLLNFGADVNVIGQTSKNTPLFEAISNNFPSICTLLLDQPSLDLTYRSPLGADTALILAAEQGMFELVEALIEKGAELNAVNHWKSSALIVAIKKGHFEVAKLLALAGADVYHKDSTGCDSLEYLKHNQEQVVALQACGESGRAQVEALQKLTKDVDNSYNIAQVGELQKVNVAVHMCKHWGVQKIDQALRMVNMTKLTEAAENGNGDSGSHTERERHHHHHRESRKKSVAIATPGTEVSRKQRSDSHAKVNGINTNTAAVAALNEPGSGGVSPVGPVSPVPQPAGGGRAAAKSLALALSESLPALHLPSETSNIGTSRSTIRAVPAKLKDNPLLVNFDASGVKLPGHWLNHLLVRSLKMDNYIRSIDLTGNDLSLEICNDLVDVLQGNDLVKCVRIGNYGLDFDLSRPVPAWFVDAKYFAACDIVLLSKVLLTWPSLFIAEDPLTHSPAVFAGGSSSSRISPVILEAFDEIASASDFHPSHIIVPREPGSQADVDMDEVEAEFESNRGFIFDIYHHAFWFHIISRDRFANLVKAITQDYPYLTHQQDHLNRTVHSQASPECKKKITSATLIYDKYQIHDYKPRHQGATSCMYFAVDVSSEEQPHPKVAMKFIKNRTQFDREVITRTKYKLDYEVVLDCYPLGNKKKEFYDTASAHLGYERLRKYKTEMKRMSTHQEGHHQGPLSSLSTSSTEESHSPLLRMQTFEPSVAEKFPYCIVYPRADADLTQIMQHEMSESK